MNDPYLSLQLITDRLIKEWRAHDYTHSNDDRHPEIKQYLDANEIPWDKINDHIILCNGKPEGKVNDRSGLSSAYSALCEAMETIKYEWNK